MASSEHPAARCSGLLKRYEDVTAVNGLDLEIHRGECFGLLGPNGAGKTTTVEILEGLTPADGGEVEILGMQWGRGKDRDIRERLGIQLQETQLGDKLRVHEVVTLFRSLYSKGRDPEEVLDLLELQPKRNAQVHKLSGGQKQRLALACALVSAPDILFLDEPTTGLDPQARLQVWDVVKDFLNVGGTVIVTTHYMEEAAHMCDRLAVMDHGKRIALGTPRELISSLGADQIIEFDSEQTLDTDALASLPGVSQVSQRMTRVVLTVDNVTAALRQLLPELDRQSIEPKGLSTHEATLEDVFVSLTGRGLRDG